MNIDFLIDNSRGDPWQHGLGFIKLYTILGYSLNFHSDIIPSPTRNLHNHTKNFRSECLIGSIKNIIYDYKKVRMSDWCLESITCKEGDEPKVIEENVYPYIISEEIQNIGDVITDEVEALKLVTHSQFEELLEMSEVNSHFVPTNKPYYQFVLNAIKSLGV